MKVYGITHRGAVRKENQDTFRYDLSEDGALLTAVLCDGMGGARGGALASGIAADAFMSHAANSLDETSSAEDMRSILTDAVDYANAKVYERALNDYTYMGMGTTLVGFLSNGKRIIIANVGDSRAYLYTRIRLKQVTVDHSLVEDLIARGKLTREEGRVHPKKNIITRAVGVEASVKADLTEIKLPASGRLLLCSDGLSNIVPDDEMRKVLKQNKTPEDACEALLALALQNGAPDNVTIFIAQH